MVCHFCAQIYLFQRTTNTIESSVTQVIHLLKPGVSNLGQGMVRLETSLTAIDLFYITSSALLITQAYWTPPTQCLTDTLSLISSPVIHKYGPIQVACLLECCRLPVPLFPPFPTSPVYDRAPGPRRFEGEASGEAETGERHRGKERYGNCGSKSGLHECRVSVRQSPILTTLFLHRSMHTDKMA